MNNRLVPLTRTMSRPSQQAGGRGSGDSRRDTTGGGRGSQPLGREKQVVHTWARPETNQQDMGDRSRRTELGGAWDGGNGRRSNTPP